MHQINLLANQIASQYSHSDPFGYKPLLIIPAALPLAIIPAPIVEAAPTPLAKPRTSGNWMTRAGFALVAVSLGGIAGPLSPMIKLEGNYYAKRSQEMVAAKVNPTPALPPSVPLTFDPLVTPDGSSIDPINTEFSLIVPKVGINASIIERIDPTNPGVYDEALTRGIAHSSLSFLPNENGTVYLFSHSTNYDWYVKDLNAVFYQLKQVDKKDTVVLFYKGIRYTYQITDKKVVNPRDINYLVPSVGAKKLILQTCWPPGSTSERLLIFADLVEEHKS